MAPVTSRCQFRYDCATKVFTRAGFQKCANPFGFVSKLSHGCRKFVTGIAEASIVGRMKRSLRPSRVGSTEVLNPMFQKVFDWKPNELLAQSGSKWFGFRIPTDIWCGPTLRSGHRWRERVFLVLVWIGVLILGVVGGET